MTKNVNKQTIQAIFTGRVQGVGFRYTVLSHGLRHNIKGIVRNLQDGSVEVIAQHTDDQIQQFIKSIQDEPGLARIAQVDVSIISLSQEYTSFEITV